MEERNRSDECCRKFVVDWSELEDADYFMDMETSIHKGKRVRGEGCYVPNSDRYDEDYVQFLEGLEEFWVSKYKVDDDDDNVDDYGDDNVVDDGGDDVDDGNDGNVVDDDGDPLYLTFLDNLKEHGNAYMCDVSMKYGVLSPIVYEEEEGDYVPLKGKPPKSDGGARRGEKRKVGVVLNNSDSRDDYSGGVKGKTMAVGDTCKKQKVDAKWRSSREDSIARKDFHQRSSEAVAGLNHSVTRKVHFDVVKGKPTTRGRNYEKKTNKVGANWQSSWEASIVHDFPYESQRSPEDTGLNHSVARKDNSDVVKRKTINSRRDDCRRKNGSVHAKGDQRSGSVCSILGDQLSAEINNTYKEFLDNLYEEGGFLIYKYGDGKKTIYGSSDKQTTDDETEPPETDISSPTIPASTLREASPNPRPLKSPRRQSTKVSRPPPSTLEPSTSIPRPATPPSREKASTTSHLPSTSTCKMKEKSYERFSSFWKELHDCLRKPYNQEEFDELMNEVSIQRPTTIYRDSRSGGTERPSGKLGRSYLQNYPGHRKSLYYYEDLNDEIKKVKSDRYKVLNLLRMFIFYMKKIPSGAPRPWLDGYSKTILPGSKLHCSN